CPPTTRCAWARCGWRSARARLEHRASKLRGTSTARTNKSIRRAANSPCTSLRIESLARSEGDYTRHKTMFDDVPGVVPTRRERGAHSTTGVDEKRPADSSCGAGEGAYGAYARIANRARRRVWLPWLCDAAPIFFRRSHSCECRLDLYLHKCLIKQSDNSLLERYLHRLTV
ncbi:hypothetical protein PFISCL1PPCAC_3728, partial [Pristionchus fissidentatus]